MVQRHDSLLCQSESHRKCFLSAGGGASDSLGQAAEAAAGQEALKRKNEGKTGSKTGGVTFGGTFGGPDAFAFAALEDAKTKEKEGRGLTSMPDANALMAVAEEERKKKK